MDNQNKYGRAFLEHSGRVLFGHYWKAAMAGALSVDRKTVSRWIKADKAPEWAVEKITELTGIAPPSGTTSRDDRLRECRDAISPRVVSMLETAMSAGWSQVEVLHAMKAIAVNPKNNGG